MSNQYQCTGFGDCSMSFTRSEHLARHVRKHTGERPFECHCGRAFSRLDNVRQHAGTVHADDSAKNAATMAVLVELHNALSVSTIFQQVAKGMVTGDVLLKSPPKAKRKPATAVRLPQLSPAGSSSFKSKMVLPSSPFEQYQVASKEGHSQQHYEHHFQAAVYGSSPPYGQTQFVHHSPSPSPRTPRTPLYAHSSHSSHPRSGSSYLDSPGSPTPHRRLRAHLPPSPQRYPEPLSYGSPVQSPPVTPTQSPRVTLPSISQLLPSPFARAQTSGTVSTEEEPIYYGLVEGAEGYEQASMAYEVEKGSPTSFYYEAELEPAYSHSISSDGSPSNSTASTFPEQVAYTHYPTTYLKPFAEPFYDSTIYTSTPRAYASRRLSTVAIMDPQLEDPRYHRAAAWELGSVRGSELTEVVAGYGGKRREDWGEERGWKRRC